MFILEYNLYEYSSTLISVKIMSRRRILTLKLPWVTKTEYQYNINQISDENKEKYQLGDN